MKKIRLPYHHDAQHRMKSAIPPKTTAEMRIRRKRWGPAERRSKMGKEKGRKGEKRKAKRRK